jgi:hypothetical protein
MQSFRRRPRPSYRQLDFCLASQPPALDTSTLPDQTQRALTGLLTRLLIGYGAGTMPELDGPPGGDKDER